MKILTIDVGGTAIKYGMMDEALNLTAKASVPTPQTEFSEFFRCLCEIYEAHKQEVEGITISMPGCIDSETGFAHTGGWLTYNNGKPIGKLLSDACGTKVYVENDGKCAILSEMWKGSLADCKNGIVMLLGTGLGGGIMIDRKLYKGRNFMAGEFSYMSDSVEQFGCADYMAGFHTSASGLVRLAQQRTGLEGLDGKRIFEKIHNGDETMRQVLRDFSKRVAVTIFNLNMVLDCDRVALGGGISRQEILVEYVRESFAACVRDEQMMKYNPALPIPEIVPCRFFNDSNMVGAMYHYLKREELA